MSWLDDLYAKFGAHRGSWASLPDWGKTEAFTDSFGLGRTADGGSNFSTSPDQSYSSQTPIVPRIEDDGSKSWVDTRNAPQTSQNPSSLKRIEELTKAGYQRNPAEDTELKNLQDTNNNTTIEMLQRERDRKLAELDDQYNMGMRYSSDARNALEGRRKGFQEDFSNNEADIYNQFGRERMGLQKSSEGQDARTTRGLLAQGIGGSAKDEALRRNMAARQQNYGNLYEGRRADERVNTSNKNERMRWADEQDAAINRYVENLGMQRNQGRNTTLDNFSDTLGRLISQAQQAAQALALSGQNIGSTEIEGIPLAGLNNGTFLNELQTAYQNSLGRDTSDTGNINANFANLSLTEQDKRLRGLLA